jgi:hypothetical protein
LVVHPLGELEAGSLAAVNITPDITTIGNHVHVQVRGARWPS